MPRFFASEYLQSHVYAPEIPDSPYLAVVCSGNLDELKDLVKLKGAIAEDDTDSAGNNALLLAARLGKSDMVAWLIDKQHFAFDAKNKDGATALSLASAGHHEEVMLILLHHAQSAGHLSSYASLSGLDDKEELARLNKEISQKIIATQHLAKSSLPTELLEAIMAAESRVLTQDDIERITRYESLRKAYMALRSKHFPSQSIQATLSPFGIYKEETRRVPTIAAIARLQSKYQRLLSIDETQPHKSTISPC